MFEWQEAENEINQLNVTIGDEYSKKRKDDKRINGILHALRDRSCCSFWKEGVGIQSRPVSHAVMAGSDDQGRCPDASAGGRVLAWARAF